MDQTRLLGVRSIDRLLGRWCGLLVPRTGSGHFVSLDSPRRKGSLRMELEASLTNTPMPAPMTPADDMMVVLAWGGCVLMCGGTGG